MKEFNISDANETLYYDCLDNGLELYFIPNKKARNFFITLNVRYGSIYTDFKIKNLKKDIKTSNGVAHFLEHLMFIEPDGTTAHENFAKLGSSINASTSYKITTYETLSTEKFAENLNYLIDYVSRLAFTKKDVEKERGIIVEEVRMGQSSPYRKLHFDSKKNVYHLLKFKDEVSGLVKDVKEITYDELVNCYNAFYHPKNMFVVITGNFNPYEAHAIIEENQRKKVYPNFSDYKLKKLNEPLKVVKEYEEYFMNVAVPKVSFNIKMSYNNFNNGNSDLVNKLYLSLFYDIKIGVTSKFNEKLIKNNLISHSLIPFISYEKESVVISFVFDSKYPNEVLKEIKNELKKIDITSADLERKKKVIISEFILKFDDIVDVNESLQKLILMYNNPLIEYTEVVRSLNLKGLYDVAKRINNNNTSTYVIMPKEKAKN